MSVLMPYILLTAGFVLIYFGAEWLVDASAKLALRLGVKPLLVALTVIAFGTSAPELMIGIQASLGGLGDIAVGNIVGSNSFNAGVILGLSAIILPMTITKQLLRFDLPMLLLASGLAWLFLRDGTLQIWEGAVFLVLIAAYTGYHIVNARQDKNERKEREEIEEVYEKSEVTGKKDPIIKYIAVIIAGLLMLVGGAHFLVKGAVELATKLGISEAIISLTIIAIGTSLPELVTTIMAALKKHNDMAVGIVIGTNIFNILCILGVVGILGPVAAPGIEMRDIFFMVLLAVLPAVMLWTGMRITRLEGAALLSVYGAYLFFLWPKQA